jgi:hypothetical protein
MYRRIQMSEQIHLDLRTLRDFNILLRVRTFCEIREISCTLFSPRAWRSRRRCASRGSQARAPRAPSTPPCVHAKLTRHSLIPTRQSPSHAFSSRFTKFVDGLRMMTCLLCAYTLTGVALALPRNKTRSASNFGGRLSLWRCHRPLLSRRRWRNSPSIQREHLRERLCSSMRPPRALPPSVPQVSAGAVDSSVVS